MQISDKAIDGISQYLHQARSIEPLQQISLLGTGAVASLEEKLERHYDMKYALCVSNATVGLWALAQALNLGETQFVTTPYTYGASVAGFLQLGCQPIFADIDAHTLTIDPEAVRQVITPDTKTILAVDIFGVPCDAIALKSLADEYGLWYIADAAQSLGAYRDGLPASSLADALVVSFTFGKSVFAGEGGAILTNNDEIYQKLLWHTQHPMRQRRELGLDLDNELAINCRIHPLAAVWADAIFEEALAAIIEHRARSFALIDALNEIGLTETISFQAQNILPSFFRTTGAWKGQSKKDELLQALAESNFHVWTEPCFIQLIDLQISISQQFQNFRSSELCLEAKNQSQRRIHFHCKSNL
jgi:perosamine synthetase